MISFRKLSFFLAGVLPALALAVNPSFTSYPDVLKIPTTFDPIIAAYWTGLPHHRRTPFAVSPDGSTAYLAYLSTTYSSVFVQPVDPVTFKATGTSVEISNAREVSGLVAQNDGFAVLVNIDLGRSDVPYPVATIMRYKGGSKSWQTAVNGPGVHVSAGLTATPDMNGDLVYSEKAGLYAAYFVVAAYSGDASGHFGDSIQYVDDNGALKDIQGASSTFGCSHNTGIAFEDADETPFASICAEDHGAIWLNTETQYMSGVKIANENTTNGVSGEPMGGMSGSYSSLSRFIGSGRYIFAWASRGAVDLTQDDWMGTGYTQASPRWLNHNVAISILATKSTLLGAEAISQVGAAVGDAQVNWITKSDSVDHQNIHVAAFDDTYALVTYEMLDNPDCQPVPLSCTGTFSGTYMQLVDNSGAKIGNPIVSNDAYVAGDMVAIGSKVCWPYVSMEWDLSAPKSNGTWVDQLSFACVDLAGASASTSASTSASPKSTTTAAASSVYKSNSTASPKSTTTAAASSVYKSNSTALPTTLTTRTKYTNTPPSTSAVTTKVSANVTESTLSAPPSSVTESTLSAPSSSVTESTPAAPSSPETMTFSITTTIRITKTITTTVYPNQPTTITTSRRSKRPSSSKTHKVYPTQVPAV